MQNERQNEIMRIISLRKRVAVGELTGRLNVSEVTIRKDLTVLEEMGYLVRTRGGAMLAEDWEHHRSLVARKEEHSVEKAAVARKALELVQEGDTIYIDSGSSCALFAAELAGMNLRVVTNSIDVVLALGDAPGIALHCVGGHYRKEAGSFIGPVAQETLTGFNIETAFLGTTGISKAGDFSSQNLIESQLKKVAILRARRTVVLTDHSKVGVEAFAVFAHADDIDVVVIDDRTDRAAFARLPFEVIIAEPASGSTPAGSPTS
ncbi:MAG TPA: DeoR/GlpR family DNA-binding transcription regulator [Spirochaetia bacterium]|nr:DeoR/GlpR family DNA-binding transcription regulator [Spirochaetia bacterium]